MATIADHPGVDSNDPVFSAVELPTVGRTVSIDAHSDFEVSISSPPREESLLMSHIDYPQMDDLGGADWFGDQLELYLTNPSGGTPTPLGNVTTEFPTPEAAALFAQRLVLYFAAGRDANDLDAKVRQEAVAQDPFIIPSTAVLGDWTPRGDDFDLFTDELDRVAAREGVDDVDDLDPDVSAGYYKFVEVVTRAADGYGIGNLLRDGAPGQDDRVGYYLSEEDNYLHLYAPVLAEYPDPASFHGEYRKIPINDFLTDSGVIAIEEASKYPLGDHFDGSVRPSADTPGDESHVEAMSERFRTGGVDRPEQSAPGTAEETVTVSKQAAEALVDVARESAFSGAVPGESLHRLIGQDTVDALVRHRQTGREISSDIDADPGDMESHFEDRIGFEQAIRDAVMNSASESTAADSAPAPQPPRVTGLEEGDAPDEGMVAVTVTESTTHRLQLDPSTLPDGYDLDDDPGGVVESAVADAVSANVGFVSVDERTIDLDDTAAGSGVGALSDGVESLGSGGAQTPGQRSEMQEKGTATGGLFPHSIGGQIAHGSTGDASRQVNNTDPDGSTMTGGPDTGPSA